MPQSDYYGVAIVEYNTTRDCYLELFTRYNLEHREPAHSVTSPAIADGAVAVGTAYWDTYDTCQIEPFSSRGPRMDGFPKPDLVAPDGVTTATYDPFYGTSPSAPHVAGGAALIKSANPSLSLDQLRNELITNNVLDCAPPGWDATFGYGLLKLAPPCTIPPTTTASFSGTPGENDWYISDVEVTLHPTDNCGSGIKATYYQIDNGGWQECPPQPQECSFTITKEGTTKIDYYSVDNIGNEETPPNSDEVKIDKTGPTTTASYSGTPGENNWYTSDVEVTLSATDNPGGSGAKATYYQIDGGGWQEYSGPFTITTEGITTIAYYSVDNAGNEEEPPDPPDEVKIDKTKPDTPVVTDDGYYTDSTTELHATWTSFDATSGIVEYWYAIGTTPGGNDVVDWTCVGMDTEVTHTGLSLTYGETYYFAVKCKDNAGLMSDVGNSDGIMPILVDVSVSAPSEVVKGESFTADVSVTEIFSNLDTAYFVLSFDPAVLQATGVHAGDLTASATPTFDIDNTNGTVTVMVNIPGLTGVSGIGTIARIGFAVIGCDPEFSDLTLSDVLLGDIDAQEIPSVVGEPTVRVNVGCEVHVRVSAPLEVDFGTSFSADVLVEDNVSNLDTAYFALSFDPAVFQATDVRAGDLITSTYPTAKPTFNIDDTNGKVTVLVNVPDLTGVSGSGTIAEIDFDVIGCEPNFSDLTLSDVLLGDIDAQEIPSIVDEPTVRVNVGCEVHVRVSAPSEVGVGTSFSADVSVIEEVSNLDTAYFALSFDPAVLAATDVRAGDLTSSATPTFNIDNTNGKVAVMVNMPGLTGVSGVGTIAQIDFAVIGCDPEFSDLTLSDVLLGNINAEEIPSIVEPAFRVNVPPCEVHVRVSAPSEVDFGTSFTAEVSVTEVSNLDTVYFSLSFDPTVLQATDVRAGDLTSSATLTFNIDNTNGKVAVMVNMPGLTGVSGVGIIAKVEFNVISCGGGSDLSLSNVLLGDINAREIESTIGDGVHVSIIPLFGDVSDDCNVTAYDASLILQHVVGLKELSSIEQEKADVTGDDTVSALDAALILQFSVGLIASFPVDSAPIAPALNPKTENKLLTEAIEQLETISLTKEQKQVLEQLKNLVFSQLIPKHAALLQNFPNPFNPDTWLPYKLASASPVTISIYNTKGQLIRAIALGNKNAGVYTSKSKAAYWDGRDSLGEKVASGVYFYQLKTGDFSATRKLLLLK